MAEPNPGDTWSSDTPISMPRGNNHPVIPMGGFGFSEFGMVHDLNDVEIEELQTPTYGPELAGDVGKEPT